MKHPNFQLFMQHDAQECMRKILEDFSFELNESNKNSNYVEISYKNIYTKIEMENTYFNNFIIRENSIISRLFYFETIKTFECACSEITYSFQTYLDLPLLIPTNKEKVSLNVLLDTFISKENVQFESICDKCFKKCNHNKFEKLCRLPKIFIISLIRFDFNNNSKNYSEVFFEDFLNLEKYIDMEIYRSNNVLFELVGIISHIGSLEYGHYYSLVKNCSSNIWYKFSDNLYEIVDFDKINKKDVCILIYNIK